MKELDQLLRAVKRIILLGLQVSMKLPPLYKGLAMITKRAYCGRHDTRIE